MTPELFDTLLTLAAAPVMDLDAPLPITPTPNARATHRVRRWKSSRHWAAYDETGELIAVTIYKRGAREIVRRLTAN